MATIHALSVNELPGDGLRFNEELPENDLRRLLDPSQKGAVRYTPSGPAHLELAVVPARDGASATCAPTIRITGRLRVRLKTACVRCLSEVFPQVNAGISAQLYPEKDPLEGVGLSRGKSSLETSELEAWDNEAFPEPDALNADAYDGQVVPVMEVVQQALLLELPPDPACEDEPACDARTQGLIDTANADIQASDAEGDPRWAALRALRREIDPANRGDGTGND